MIHGDFLEKPVFRSVVYKKKKKGRWVQREEQLGLDR